MQQIAIIEFNKEKCELLEYRRDLCLGRLYVIKVDNPDYNNKNNCCEFSNPEYYYIDAVYIGSTPIYCEEGYYQRERYLFAEINDKNIYEIFEPEYQVFLDEQYNIRSRNL